MENHMTVTFDAISENEAFARMVVSAFMVGANPTVGEMDDVKTAVSEAVTNAVIHGYDKKTGKEIELDTGKTYISLIPSDSWSDLVIK